MAEEARSQQMQLPSASIQGMRRVKLGAKGQRAGLATEKRVAEVSR